MRTGEVRIGISGWRYAPWRGVFYPEGLRQRQELAYASRLFSSIELNGSFYSLQTPSSYAEWRDVTPEDFVFAVKGPRYITHVRRLQDVETALANFFASGLFELQHKLGPMLWQCPPSLPFDLERFDAFFSLLPRDGAAAQALALRHDDRVKGRTSLSIDRGARLRHAVEIRHESFRDPAFVALLRRHQIALVVADTAGKWPLLEDLTSDFVYLRLHGDQQLYASGYGDAALADWAVRIEAWQQGGQSSGARLAAPTRGGRRRSRRDVYVYFDNDVKVHAPYDAAALAHRLGLPSPLAGHRQPVWPEDWPIPSPRPHAPVPGRVPSA